MYLAVFIAFVIIQRVYELRIANRNAKAIIEKGGYEVGKEHYPVIVLLHVLFIISVLFEGSIVESIPRWWPIPLIIFLIAQGLRFWVIQSLGMYWNTRIYILPDAEPVQKGPYRFMKHPNYVIVMAEMISIPLLFGAYFTAVLFPILNAMILMIRIRIEEEALNQLNYQTVMEDTPRFVPSFIIRSLRRSNQRE